MKQRVSFLLVAAMCLAHSAIWSQTAQSQRIIRQTKPLAHRADNLTPVLKPTLSTGVEGNQENNMPTVPLSSAGFRGSGLVEEITGTTTYDLQSNGTESARLYSWPDGNISTAFTVSNANDGSNWPDRGTGYNQRSAWMAGTQVNSRIEASTRTGFPNYVVTASGTEFIVAHKGTTTAGKYQLHTLRRSAGQSAWTEATIPTNVPKGALWSKAAVDGENIYVIALTSPNQGTIGGEVFRGVNGHILFWRSKDGGATWDIQDGVIPGLDSTSFARITAETYCMDARDGIVAIGVFDSWNDSKIFKSTDGGETWEPPYTVIDFPLTKYVTDKGYTLDEIGGVDPNAPNDYAIFSSDGGGSVLIDNAGLVHAFTGYMYVMDTILTDANTNYFPGFTGVIYWNQSAPDDLSLVADIIDVNQNDTIDINITGIAYNSNSAGMATSAIDENGNLYLAYSACVENLSNDDGLTYRHVYVTKSFDYGATWTDPVDVHYATNDPILADFQEGVYPFFEKRVKNQLNMVYQRDYLPGASVLTTAAEPAGSTSDIVFIANADLVGTKNTLGGTLDFALAPNPASDFARVSFTTEKSAELVLEIFNTLGARVKTQVVNAPAGPVTLDVNTSDLGTGLYFVRVGNGKDFGTRKLMISKN